MGAMNTLVRKKLPFYLFAAVITVATVFGLWYVYSIGGPAVIPRRSTTNEFGKMLGGVVFVTLAAMYGRTALKWVILKSGWLDTPDMEELKTLSGQLLSILNVTHPYVGLVAVSSTFLHCAFTNSLRDNVFLYAVLFFVFLSGLTGMLMKISGMPPTFFKGNYFLHSRFILGIVLVFLTFLGHVLVKF